MTFKYLDLRKFFSFTSQDVYYYLNAECLKKMFDMRQFELNVIYEMAQNQLVVGFVKSMLS